MSVGVGRSVLGFFPRWMKVWSEGFGWVASGYGLRRLGRCEGFDGGESVGEGDDEDGG